jgi:hypothetical protein
VFARADDTGIAGKNLDPSLCSRDDELSWSTARPTTGQFAVDFGAWEERRKIPKL